MRRFELFVIALMVALLAVGQGSRPVSAAATCGDTYKVQRGDYLSKIAKTCEVSLSALLAANPEIKNANQVYPGQVIRIKNDPSIPVTGGGNRYIVQRGDTLSGIAYRYGVTLKQLMLLNPTIDKPALIYVGQVITLPDSATLWNVALSTRTAKPGAVVEVKVQGFPGSANIDYRLGKQGLAYSVVVDGKTDANGAASAKVTIPSTAKAGEKWVVLVLTTDLKKGVALTSETITIQ